MEGARELAGLIALRALRGVGSALPGAYRTRFCGSGLDFTELADYPEGDDARFIQWPLSLRKGRLLIKRFEEERETPLILAVDASLSMRLSAGSWQTALDAAALLAACAVICGDPVALLACAKGTEQYVPSARGRRQLFRITASLVSALHHGRETAIGTLLSRVAGLAAPRSRIVVISDFLDNAPWLPQLRHLVPKHDVIACRILHNRALPWGSAFTLEDAESGRVFRFTPRMLPDGTRMLEDIRHQITATGAGLFDIQVGQAPAIPMLAFFKRTRR